MSTWMTTFHTQNKSMIILTSGRNHIGHNTKISLKNIGDLVMENNLRVYFDTMLGNLVVDGRIETNFVDYVGKLNEKDTFKEIECSLFIKTQIAGSPIPKERELKIGYVVYRDLLSIKKANEESDERHQVDMSTLEIWRVSIDREFLRITWTFDDGNGRRIICGNLNVIHERDERRDECWHVLPAQKFQVAW